MNEVDFSRTSNSRRGSAQVRLPGRRRRALVRWSDGGSVSVCLPGSTASEREEVATRVTEALFWRRVGRAGA